MAARARLWHPESPGTRIEVTLAWWRRPFARWIKFATISEVLAEYRRRGVR